MEFAEKYNSYRKNNSVMRIQICKINVESGSVWRDTNPDPVPGHKVNVQKYIMAKC